MRSLHLKSRHASFANVITAYVAYFPKLHTVHSFSHVFLHTKPFSKLHDIFYVTFSYIGLYAVLITACFSGSDLVHICITGICTGVMHFTCVASVNL